MLYILYPGLDLGEREDMLTLLTPQKSKVSDILSIEELGDLLREPRESGLRKYWSVPNYYLDTL